MGWLSWTSVLHGGRDAQNPNCRASPQPQALPNSRSMMAGAPEAADPSPDVGTVSVDASPSVPPTAAAPLTVDERFALVRSVGEECIQEGELMNLLVKKTVPVCYDGFELRSGNHEGDLCEQAEFSWVQYENMDCLLNNKKELIAGCMSIGLL